jgi:phosphatidylinositol-3-phosphatase
LLRYLRRATAGAAVTCSLLALASAGSASAASAASARLTDPAAAAPHVMVIMMENTDYSQAIGSPAMPYLNDLVHQYGGFSRSYGWRYPSLPNYMELMAGTTLGISSDCDPGNEGCTDLSHQLFVDQLAAQGVSWHAYYQDDVSGCDNDPSDFFTGNYDVEHNVFPYFGDFSAECPNLSNFTTLVSDLSSPRAADFNFVVPDLDNDGGDNGTMASGDTWLSGAIPQIMNTSWYREGGQIVILYDTGYGDSGGFNGSSGGRIPPVTIVSAHTAGMGLSTAPVNTAGVLRSLEQVYGVAYLGDAGNASNGSLLSALVAGRPHGPSPRADSQGAVVSKAGTAHSSVNVTPAALAFNGVYRFQNGSTIEVGNNHDGEGFVKSSGHGPISVPGTTNLLSVSCTTTNDCWAVGLGAPNSDQAAIVQLVDGKPLAVRADPAFYGLYGIDCSDSTSCVAVGYDTSDIADAVTTITSGVPSAPAEVAGGGEWLNSISCPTASQCYATGLVNYTASIVPISDGVPQTPITIPNAWYLNAIDCTSVGNCVVAGEAGNEGQGFVGSLVNGSVGPDQEVPGTEYLYGVGCALDGDCLLTGASKPGTDGYSSGVTVADTDGQVGTVTKLPGTNGLGQTQCGVEIGDCTTVGSTTS